MYDVLAVIDFIKKDSRFKDKPIILYGLTMGGSTVINAASNSEHVDGIIAVISLSKDEMKSIGRSATLPEDISDIEKEKFVLMQLVDEVGMTARLHNKKGSTVQITIRYSNFDTITRQETIPKTNMTKEILSSGIKLLTMHWNQKPSKTHLNYCV